MNISNFYSSDYGDGSFFVGCQEACGRKSVLLRDLCRSVSLEVCTIANEYYLNGMYKSGMSDYFDLVIHQIKLIDDSRKGE